MTTEFKFTIVHNETILSMNFIETPGRGVSYAQRQAMTYVKTNHPEIEIDRYVLWRWQPMERAYTRNFGEYRLILERLTIHEDGLPYDSFIGFPSLLETIFRAHVEQIRRTTPYQLEPMTKTDFERLDELIKEITNKKKENNATIHFQG